MTITISTQLNDARLTAVRDFLDSGTGAGKIRIYNGARPGHGGAATLLLVEIPLQEPCGSVFGGVLTLESSDSALAVNSGVATWARVLSGNDEIAFDCDCSDGAGSGDIKLLDTNLLAGGQVQLLSGVLG